MMKKRSLSPMQFMMYMLTDRSLFLGPKRAMRKRCKISGSNINLSHTDEGDDE